MHLRLRTDLCSIICTAVVYYGHRGCYQLGISSSQSIVGHSLISFIHLYATLLVGSINTMPRVIYTSKEKSFVM